MSSGRKIWGSVVVCTVFIGCGGEPRQAREHPENASYIVETSHLAPVIAIDDVAALGFDTTTIYNIEPHFAMLNTALVALAELKKSYDAALDPQQRSSLNAYAIPFHITADRHQRAILLALKPPLDSVFDRYVEDRKRAVGLIDWHVDHREAPSGREVPGLMPPRTSVH